jgi:hypothetical protein
MPASLLDLARDPATPGARLHGLAAQEDPAVRLAVAANPALLRETMGALVIRVGRERETATSEALARAILGNPAMEFFLIEDASWLLRLPAGALLELARSAALTPVVWMALRGHEDFRIRMRLLHSPLAPPGSWREAGFASEFDALVAALGCEGQPAAQLAMARAMIAHPELTRRLREQPSWLREQVGSVALALARAPSLTRHLWGILREGASMADVKLSLVRSPVAPPEAWSLLDLPTGGAWDLEGEMLNAVDLEGLLRCPSPDAFTALNFTGNHLEDRDLVVLFRGPVFPRLTALDLSNNLLGYRGTEGVDALVQSTSFPALTALDLSDNLLDNAACVALSRGAFPCLRELHLSDNKVSEEGIRALVQAAFFPSLMDLSIQPAMLDETSRAILLDAATAHPHLRLS